MAEGVCEACEPPPVIKAVLVNEAALVTHVAHPMAPAELIVIGDVPLNPALPMFAIGMAVGITPTGNNPPLSCGTSLPVEPSVPNAAVPSVPPVPILSVEPSVPVSVSVLPLVNVFPFVMVKVPVLVEIVRPSTVVGTIAPKEKVRAGVVP
jgi:hypothetical protein